MPAPRIAQRARRQRPDTLCANRMWHSRVKLSSRQYRTSHSSLGVPYIVWPYRTSRIKSVGRYLIRRRGFKHTTSGIRVA
eukprot:3941961-Rhodomonas_salina.7